ncbi:helix-turn-helix transcriptional regulator [Intestinibacillus sp. NTUH-41-i26]|uniref:helix-turn-helix domain-containing protein n=1 Tax=Butyricicoccaceae TaxID=3085642 RepID=UPI000D1EA7D1|nr:MULTISPECIES: helix-turn-helix transcriptional regulator [Butyricicoccaceae]WOC74317.1 helix-turn-helix transcriptional regulator [Intestinibacillus sp. NTUH-41-i26]
MIICNLAILLAERKLKISKVSADTGVSRTTLTALYYNSGKGVQFDTANSLCIYLSVSMSDLFTVVPIDFSVDSCSISLKLPWEGDGKHLVAFTLKVVDKKRTEFPHILGVIDKTGEVTFDTEQNANSSEENQFLSNALNKLPRAGRDLLNSMLASALEAEIKSNEEFKQEFSNIFLIDFKFPQQFENSSDNGFTSSFL